MGPWFQKQCPTSTYVALRRLLSSPHTHSGNIDNPDALLQQIHRVMYNLLFILMIGLMIQALANMHILGQWRDKRLEQFALPVRPCSTYIVKFLTLTSYPISTRR